MPADSGAPARPSARVPSTWSTRRAAGCRRARCRASSADGRVRIEPELLDGELVGVGRLAACGSRRRCVGIRGSVVDEQLGAERDQPRAQLARGLVGADRRARRAAYTGPVSSPASSSMMHTPVSASPARIARSTGAAPRQRGSSEKCTFTNPSGSASSSAGGRIWPNATTTPSSAPARGDLVDDLARRSGVRTGRPSSLRRGLHRARLGRSPRPRRRSGWVTTNATSWPASSSAWRAGTASSGVPKKTRRTELSDGSGRRSVSRPRSARRGAHLAGAHLAHRLAARVGLEPVEHQHAVEVVDLVLDHAGEQLVALDHDLVAVEVEAPHRDELGPHDLEREAGHREAPSS